jgi:uncharacterized protein YbjT (DUF2867 family)
MPVIRIAFVGATGMLGKPVAGALQNGGHAVRVVSRDIERARAALGGQFEYATAGVADVTELARAFEGVDAVYINLSTSPRERESSFHAELDGIRNIVLAAKRSGVTRVLYLSSLMQRFDGSSWWVLRVKREAVGLIKDSGLVYTLFYPSNFMENLFYRNKQGSRINLAGTFRHRNYWIAATDYAAQVVASLRLTVANREYVVQGPAALTYPEAAEMFARHFTAESLKVSRAPLGVLKVVGLFSRELGYVARILDTIGRQPESFEAEATWHDLGTPQTSIADYARSLSG